MFNIESHIGENVTLENNNGFLEAIYYPDGIALEMGSIAYEMNDKASGISKDELLNTIDSIKETKELLPDHTDDSIIKDIQQTFGYLHGFLSFFLLPLCLLPWHR